MIFRLWTPIIFFSSFLSLLHFWLVPPPSASTSVVLSNPSQPVTNIVSNNPTRKNLKTLPHSKHLDSPTSTPYTLSTSSKRKDRFGSLMSSRLERIRNECKRMREIGDLRDSWLLPENFITSTRSASEITALNKKCLHFELFSFILMICFFFFLFVL